ncbi:hypothetical protein HK101_004830 [Irineochytrium annulatum]|nr:hypothetical protein HK101_004830 [Irineochytrium annulatum]
MLRAIRSLNPFTIKSQMRKIDRARETYEACARQFNEEHNFAQTYNLPPKFHSWFAVTVLHVWIRSVRLRSEGREGNEMKQEVFDHLWLDVEIRLHKEGVRTQLGRIVGDLLSTYYGQTLAYDEGLALGDATMAAALWRNIYSGKDVSAADLAKMVEHVRSTLSEVAKTQLSETEDTS